MHGSHKIAKNVKCMIRLHIAAVEIGAEFFDQRFVFGNVGIFGDLPAFAGDSRTVQNKTFVFGSCSAGYFLCYAISACVGVARPAVRISHFTISFFHCDCLQKQ